MLNILIVENNILHIKNIVNFLSRSIPEVRIYGIEPCGINSLDVISSLEPDLIILDQELPDTSGMDIINHMKKHNLNKYLNSVILIGNNINKKYLDNPFIHSYFPKPINYKELVRTINYFIRNEFCYKIIEDKIYSELTKLNFNFAHIGTKYLIEAIILIYFNNTNNFILSKEVYPIIAKKYNTNINTVKCDILHAIINSYYECEEDFLASYFRIFPLTKPKTKYVIYTILSKL